MELNNREWASLIWLTLAFAWALSRRDLRSSMGGVARAAWHPKILVPLLAMIAYSVGLVCIGWRVGLWNAALLKGTIIWFIASGLVLLFNLNQAWEERRFFRRTVLRTLELTVFLAFFVNLYVFSLPVELIFQPVVVLLVTLSLVAGREPAHQVVKKSVDGLLALGGFGVAFFVAIQLVRTWGQLHATGLLIDLALPVWMTLGLLPFLSLMALYAAYESAFIRINFMIEDRSGRRRAKLALMLATLGRIRLLNGFGGHWAKEAGSAGTLRGARREIYEFLDFRRQREAEIEEEKARLVRSNANPKLTD